MHPKGILLKCIHEGIYLPWYQDDFEKAYKMTDEYLLDAVLNTVLDVTKQKRNNVLSVKRIRETCVYPRQIVFFVMSKGYEWSLYRISKTFNDIGFPMIMNHATIIHNVKTLTNYMETDRYVNRTVKEVFESLNLKLN